MKKNTKKAKPSKSLIGFSFGPKGNRQAIYLVDCDSRQQFMQERKSAKRYGYNVRDIHGSDPKRK